MVCSIPLTFRASDAASAPACVVSGGIASLVVLGVVALTIPALRAYRIDR